MRTIKRYSYKTTGSSSLPPWVVGLIALLVIGLGITVFLLVRPAHKTPAAAGERDMLKTVQEVGQLMILPSGETPTVATVQDVTKLSGQVFFANAKNGDKVLIYLKAQKSILYRPSINKIVNVGPVITGKSGSPYVTSSFTILNGTGDKDYTQNMVSDITSLFPNSTVTGKDTAPRTFPNTIVIDLTKKNGTLAEQIADSLGYKTGQQPVGITPPSSADFLVIIGQDFKP